jgi:asparagine synthase (glutamine-hydrolysing)
MCGIAGAFAYGSRPPASLAEQVERACSRMRCRGPDGDGLWRSDDGRVALAHRRLAVIDLSERGAQPMVSADESVVVSFNGEIYNYRQLRCALEKQGCQFESDSDTEVLLHLYARRGVDMFEDVRGMFALVLWDSRKQGMLLARDPFGIKPLYYADDGACIRTASEVKGLIAGGYVDRSPEPAGHVGFFLWGHVPEPYTLYRGIRALPPGSTMWIDADGTKPVRRYADVTTLLRDSEASPSRLSPSDGAEELRGALLDSVRHHLVSDVEVGVFLSAGLDSATLAALGSEAGGRLRTVTLGFEEYRGTEQDETPLAATVAACYGTRHQTVWVSRDDFRQELDRLIDRMDQPTIDGVNSYFVARAASQAGLKVALSGLGGDELFGGYPSFRELPTIVSLIGGVPAAAPLGRGLRTVSAPILNRWTSPKYAGLLEYGGTFPGAYLLRRGLFLPWELSSVLDEELVREGWDELSPMLRLGESVAGLTSDRMRVRSLETSWYMRNQLLRDMDWASMTHSLEARVPLVDWTLWRRVAPLAAQARTLDKRAMARTPSRPMPDAVLRRAKTGFAIPTQDWVKREPRDSGPRQRSRRSRGLRDWATYLYDRTP